MAWLQLDPDGILARAKAAGTPVPLPSLGASVLRGVVGATLLSVAGFAPWALGGRWVQRAVGEAGMYAACAIVYIVLSGPLLHRLLLGPGSLRRFYALFGVAFAANAVGWTAAWMALRGLKGSLAGLLAGTAAMGAIFAWALGAWKAALPSIAALFAFTSIGYFAGGWVESAVARAGSLTTGMLLWGVCYGIGFGAGLGIAFHLLQTEQRSRLARRE